MHYTAFDVTNCTIDKQQLFVTYVPPTCFSLYKVIFEEIYARAYRYNNGLKCLKVKVKFSRYRPSVAQRVGRGIALLFHDHGTGQQHVPAAL